MKFIRMKATSQSPGSITGFFAIFKNGSTGASLNIAEGMKTKVTTAKKDSFMINGKKTNLPVSKKVLELFRKKTKCNKKVKIEHKTKFPIGFGLGISGAGALSLALALNKALKTKLKKSEAVKIASQAEIECGTGLGDVTAEQFHGLLIGKKPYPSKKAWIITPKEKYVVLGFFKPIKTKKIIRSKKWKKKINKIGLKCMEEIEKEKTAANFTKLARKFTLETGLATPKIKKVILEIDKASMSMLGETIFIITNKPKNEIKKLKKYCKKIIVAKVAKKGAK